MSRDTTVIPFRQPDAIDDPLTELAREGARRILAQALIAEADTFVALWKDLKLPDGRDRVVRRNIPATSASGSSSTTGTATSSLSRRRARRGVRTREKACLCSGGVAASIFAQTTAEFEGAILR